MKDRGVFFWAGLFGVLISAAAAPCREIVEKHTGTGWQSRYVMAGGGVAVPTSSTGAVPDYEGSYKMGTLVRAGIAFRMNERVLFGPEFEYQHYPNKANVPPFDRNVSVVEATVRYSLSIRMPKSRAESVPEQNTAYVLVGSVGMASIDEWGDTRGSGFVAGGLGIMRRYGRHFTVTFDARFQYTFDNGEHFLPFVLGVAF